MWHVDQFTEWLEELGSQNIRGRYSRQGIDGQTHFVFIPPKVPGRGCVMMIHGTGNDMMFTQTHLFKNWHEQGFGIFTFDLDGHGRSSSTVFHPEQWEGIVPSAVEKLRSLAPDEPLHVVGYSIGAALLVNQLVRHDLHVKSCVLIAAPLELKISLKFILRELQLPFYPSFRHRLSDYSFLDLIPAIGPFHRRRYPIRAHSEQHYSRTAAQIIAAATESLPEQVCKVPTLMIHGELDLIAPPENSDKLLKYFDSGSLHIGKGENHCSVLLAESTNIAIKTWLKGF